MTKSLNQTATEIPKVDYDVLLALKRSISEEFINPSRKQARVFSLAPVAATNLAAPTRTVREIKEGILGVGVTKPPGGGHALKIFLDETALVPPEKLVDYFGLQSTPVQIKRTKPLQLQETTAQHRPPFPGISVGHYKGSTGTFGAVVRDDKGQRYMLSNNHILANSNRGKKSDPILQPGPQDATSKDNIIAHLFDFIPIKMGGSNYMDAAIAALDMDVSTTSIAYCGPVQSVGNPQLESTVKKYGRTTLGRTGVIITTDVDYQVFFNQTLVSFNDLFEIKGVYENGKIVPFSEAGDSGSLVIAPDTCEAVGLLFAGIEGNTSFACPLAPILDTLNVVLV